MIYTIIVKAKFSVPVTAETETLQEALGQAGKAVLEHFTGESMAVELTPVAEWTVREEAVQTVLTHLTQAMRDLLDLYATVGAKIYEEPAIINALAILQEAESANAQINETQRMLNGRSATAGDTNQVC